MTNPKIKESIKLNSDEVVMLSRGLRKVYEWTIVARENELRKRYEKRAVCFPASDCMEKKMGNTSTEVNFLIYEDGSTSAKIKRNKGNFSSEYNFSVESSLLLAAYLDFVRDKSEREFKTQSMTREDLDTLFQ